MFTDRDRYKKETDRQPEQKNVRWSRSCMQKVGVVRLLHTRS